MRIQDSVPEDSRSVAEHAKAPNEEMKKSKPRDSVLLPLMKHDRRIFVQNDAASVTEILDNCPALARPAVVKLTVPYVIVCSWLACFTSPVCSWLVCFMSLARKTCQP